MIHLFNIQILRYQNPLKLGLLMKILQKVRAIFQRSQFNMHIQCTYIALFFQIVIYIV
jgi:hypothetical protein